MNKHLFIALGVIFTMLSCTKDNIDGREKDTSGDFFFRGQPFLQRGSNEITVHFSNEGYIIDYVGDVRDPDYYIILYSVDNQNFQDSIRKEYYDTEVTVEGLENDVPIYVKIKTYAEGFDTEESYTAMTVPTSDAVEVKDLEYDISLRVNRFNYSTDGKYILTEGSGDGLSYTDLSTGVSKKLNINTYLGSWAPESNRFVFVDNIVRDNQQYHEHLITYDVESEKLDTILAIDQTGWYSFNPRFGLNSEQIIYSSNKSNGEIQIEELWSLDINTKKEEKLTTFKEDGFMLWSFESPNTSGDIFLSGSVEGGQSLNLYKFNINTLKLSPIDTTDFDSRFPRVSPQGDKIAFTSYRSGSEELWILDLNTRQYRQVTDGSNKGILKRSFVWGPDDNLHAVKFTGSDYVPVVLKL